MNLNEISGAGIGGVIGGGLVLLKDIFFGVNKRLARVEEKLDNVVSSATCKIMHDNAQTHMADMNVHIQYIRGRLDAVLLNLTRRREDDKP